MSAREYGSGRSRRWHTRNEDEAYDRARELALEKRDAGPLVDDGGGREEVAMQVEAINSGESLASIRFKLRCGDA